MRCTRWPKALLHDFQRRGLVPFVGFLALIWFLTRVIPKPSRATYPCQRAAFPVAAAFLAWLAGTAASGMVGARARSAWREARPLPAVALFALAGFVFVSAVSMVSTPVTAGYFRLREELFPTPVPAMVMQFSRDDLTVPPSAIVGMVKSPQAHAEDIELEEISDMVHLAVERAGGLGGVVSDGDTVILKPNLIASRDFTASEQRLTARVNGIATDYRVIQAAVDAVREVNPSGAIFLMEGSGVGITRDNAAVVRWDEVIGLDSLIYLEEACGAWWDTTSTLLQGVSLPEDKALYVGANNRYWLNKLYYRADCVISLPVLKNHFVSGITGAVKNVGIGATPPTIYGLGPQYENPYERSDKIDHGYSYTARLNLHYWIHDFYMCRPVDFVIMDGLQGIQNGPLCHEFLNGSQHISEDQMNARLIMASRDPIALDAIESLLCGHDPLMIPHLVTLHNDSLGCVDPGLIRVEGGLVGDEKQDFETEDSGLRSKYSDFEPPYFAVDSCYVVGDELHVHVDEDGDLLKIEVTIDGVFLGQIRRGDFGEFHFDLGTVEIGPESEIVVYAYDCYLNHSLETVTSSFPQGVNPGPDEAAELRIEPTLGGSPTRIHYRLDRAQEVDLTIHDLEGRRISVLTGGIQPAGEHEVMWRAHDQRAGVYLVRLSIGGSITSRKVIISE